MARTALTLPRETEPTELEDQEQMEADMDSIHILPLNIIPLKTPSLRRAKLIKNVRLESVIELFSDTGGGSGQIDAETLADMFDWPKNGKHPDERVIAALTELHSFDVYSLRIQLRKLGIRVEQFNQRLRLSDKKCAELMQYMNTFTLPLLQQVYNTTDSTVDNMEELVKKFTTPDRQEALKNLKIIADKLHISVQEVPNFLEEYADIYLSISYGKDILNSLIPKILSFEESMEELKENYELRNDVRLMRCIDYIKDSITDVTASVVSRFESFDRSSETMWNDISAESFDHVKKLTRNHHISIGAILCGLSVKMNGWEQSLAKGRGLVRRADFVRSDMMQGMEKISQIEEILMRQQAVPTWESFTIETGRK